MFDSISVSPSDSDYFYQESESNIKPDETLEKLKIEGNVQRCPWCGAYIEKDGGCNIIKCSSEICQKNIESIFCYLCGEKLFQETKLDHFIDQNSNANYCFGLKYSSTKGESNCSVSNEESQSNLDLKEFCLGGLDMNKILDTFNLKTCPRCLTKKNLVLQMDSPLFFKCANNGCGSKFLVCLICNKTLQNSELDDHLKIERKYISSLLNYQKKKK